ncbi:GntR family transcriptional regulator [Lichenihabitans psoromatis]|uniref:GntR family transcriptional regulator n=1 Tax=Lichenihabitans psoromatis TaxID=2528642 RepID=UPI0013F16FBA|nr:GntR family transcriptional regulator [Lichenihabitans psoromatis]
MLDAIVQAIAERRLAPGIKLAEEQLAEIFGLNRARIRKVLLVLSQRRIVQLSPNRGATVARPTAKETREVFQARRLIEAELVRLVAALPGPQREAAIASLRTHLAAEHQAIEIGDRNAEVRLSGLFHLRLAQAAGNSIFSSILRDLIAQSSLAVSAHATGHQLDCSLREHDSIVDALAASDTAGALSLSLAHLIHIEAALALNKQEGTDLVAIFSTIRPAVRKRVEI